MRNNRGRFWNVIVAIKVFIRQILKYINKSAFNLLMSGIVIM